MKRTLILFLLSAWILPSYAQNSSRPPDHSITAAEVVRKFIQASGGAELEKIGTEKKKGMLVRGVSGQVPFESVSTGSGKWHYHQAFAYGDQVSYGYDGSQAWVQDARRVSTLPAEEQLELALLFDIQAPLKLEKLFPKLSVKGSEKKSGKEAVVLSALSGQGFVWELAFDPETGLLVRAGDLFFEDYRDVGRVKRPFLIWLGDESQNPLRLKMQVSEIRQNEDVDNWLFSRPACILPIVEPLLYKLRTEALVGQEALEACAGIYQSDEDPNVLYTVTTQGPHLMIERTGWGTRVEILPESETDYFMRFLHREFHFVKDGAGRVTGLETGPDRSQKARKIK